jgi:hypothetical protein
MLELKIVCHPIMTSVTPEFNRWLAILRDIQFWVPLSVLIIGLLLLRWVGA